MTLTDLFKQRAERLKELDQVLLSERAITPMGRDKIKKLKDQIASLNFCIKEMTSSP